MTHIVPVAAVLDLDCVDLTCGIEELAPNNTAILRPARPTRDGMMQKNHTFARFQQG